MNHTLALNNPEGVDIPLYKQTNQTEMSHTLALNNPEGVDMPLNK